MKKIKIKYIKLQKIILLLSLGLFLFFYFPSVNAIEETTPVENKNTNQKEKVKEKYEKLEKKIKKEEKYKAKEEEKKLRISSEIGSLNNNIAVTQSELKKTDTELEAITKELKKRDKLIEKQKDLLRGLIQKMNQLDLETNLIFMKKEGSLGEYFMLTDGLEKMEEKLFKGIEEIRKEKAGKEEEKKKIEEIYEIKEDQKSFLQSEKNKKNYLLNRTQGKINLHEATIAKLQAKISKLQREFSSLLGKGYNTEDIKEAVKFAAGATGVRKNFLMGMLVVESGLGRYTGSCNYKESKMNKHRKVIFKQLCKELGYNYKKKKLSCPPKNYKGTGGAMGVAQFMPDTWKAYESQIASRTGHHPPDPWNLVDGVTAMASKLARDGANSKKGECQAAKRYLGGSHQWYCDKVLYWADNYEDLL